MEAGEVGEGGFAGLEGVEDVDVRAGGIFAAADGSEDADFVNAVGFPEIGEFVSKGGEDTGSDGGVGFVHGWFLRRRCV